MADNKKYYYLKLKDNFYDSEQLIILQNMQDGYLYSDILMKLYLRSLKNEGKLMFNNMIPYTPQVLAQVVRHQVGTVEKALKIFQELGLIEILDNGAIYMMDIQNFIGKSSTEADRIRNFRKQIAIENKDFVQMYNKSTPEIEKEKEKELDIEKELYKYIEENFGRTLNQVEIEQVQKWLLLYDIEIIKEAIKTALLQNKKNFKYITGILNNWQGKTLEEIKQEDAKDKKPEWYGKEITKEEVSDKELEELEDMFKDFK